MFWFVLLDERSAHVKAVARRCPVQKSAGGYELFLYCERRGKTRHIAYATKMSRKSCIKTWLNQHYIMKYGYIFALYIDI